MSLLKNRFSLCLVIAAVLLVNAYFCSVSVVWMMAFCILAPMTLSWILRRFMDEHDYAEDLENADWRND